MTKLNELYIRLVSQVKDEEGSQGLEAAGVAVAAATVAAALIGFASSVLSPGIQGILARAVSIIGF